MYLYSSLIRFVFFLDCFVAVNKTRIGFLASDRIVDRIGLRIGSDRITDRIYLDLSLLERFPFQRRQLKGQYEEERYDIKILYYKCCETAV